MNAYNEPEKRAMALVEQARHALLEASCVVNIRMSVCNAIANAEMATTQIEIEASKPWDEEQFGPCPQA